MQADDNETNQSKKGLIRKSRYYYILNALTPRIPSPASGRGVVPNAGIRALPRLREARERESGGWGYILDVSHYCIVYYCCPL